MGKISLYAPIAYLVLLLSSLALFSTIYRRRKVRRLVGLQPWFGEHDSRDIYLSLRAQTSPKVPEKMLKAALLRRATEDVRRIMSLQESKPALGELHQRGAVGDEIWTRFLAAEKVMDAEIMECAGEANFIKPGWAQTLFPSAAEIVQNSRIRERLAQVPELQKEEREKWEKVREKVLSELENENDTGATETEAKKANKKKK
ncbi:Sec62/63 complex, subunit Sec66 [Lipomyces doorenjongii]|uniref:Sec62/63 complex, subunit Sec66 n=1 Tax=Lipomyces doorenjongii TaxID=383834 RepID=UPI003343DC97